MEVSHFELIWKPQSPASPIGVSGIDKVFQGYFLEITNLENEDYRYALEFVAVSVPNPLRSLAGNTVVFIDTPNVNNAPGVLSGTIATSVFTPSQGSFVIPARATALVAVLPSAFAGLPLDPTPLPDATFEVRGYVRLRLPVVRRKVRTPFGIKIVRVAQSADPVRVLLTPQNRSTYFTNTGVLSDQTQASLPTASGAAVNLLPPDQPRFIGPFRPAMTEELMTRIDSLTTDIDPITMLTAMLSAVDMDRGDLKEMNSMLAEAGVGVTLEPRAAPRK